LVVAGDVDTLLSLCAPCSDAGERASESALLSDPAQRTALRRVLHTHPETTDGYTNPGLSFGGPVSEADLDDARLLGVSVSSSGGTPTAAHHGISTSFEDPAANGTDEYKWAGVHLTP
jgi:hypothetical protein